MTELYTEQARQLNAVAGHEARMRGEKDYVNPLPRGTMMRDDWCDGWNAAHNSKEAPPLKELTSAQSAALKWLARRGNEGSVNRNGVVMAGGELAGVMRSTWNALRDAGMVEISAKTKRLASRVILTDAGYIEANSYGGAEASTVTVEDEQ